MKKNTLKTICFFLLIMHISCQVTNVVSLNSYNNINGSYKKDLDNVLPFFEGTWKGVVNDKEYIFINSLFIQHLEQRSNVDYKYIDVIKCKFKVRDLITDHTLYDDTNIINYEDYKIIGLTIQGVQFDFLFLDTEANCFNQVRFSFIKNVSNSNQIIYKNFKELGTVNLDPCLQNQEDIPMFLPKVDLVLTRQ